MKKELLINGDNSFQRIIERIRETKNSLYMQMFIWRDDKIGNDMARELLDAADRGVKIKIVKDEVGSIFEKTEEGKQSFFHKKFNPGLLVQMKVMGLLYFQHVNHIDGKQKPNTYSERMLAHPNIEIDSSIRNDHTKFYIFDDEILIAGGVNIEDKELYLDYKQNKWCDYMIEIIDKDIVKYFLQKLDRPETQSPDASVDFYFNFNDRNVYQVKPKLFELLDEAQHSIIIEMAYFGDPDVTRKIIECINRGVKVSILTSLEANIQNSINHHVLNQISKATQGKVEIFLSDRVVHSKLVCVDDKKLFFGSANYNKKGMVQLSELNIYFEADEEMLQIWQTWRKQHIEEECRPYPGHDKDQYSKILALAESVFC
ncbi:MAG: phospholipase D-like domain-containing protein [Ignavibacteriales bacterium]